MTWSCKIMGGGIKRGIYVIHLFAIYSEYALHTKVFIVSLEGRKSNIISVNFSRSFAIWGEHHSSRSQFHLHTNVKMFSLMHGQTSAYLMGQQKSTWNFVHKGLRGDLWKGKEIYQNWGKVLCTFISFPPPRKKSELLHDKFSLLCNWTGLFK